VGQEPSPEGARRPCRRLLVWARLYGNHLACGGTLQPTTFGVAHKALACGTKVRLCVKRCVTAPVIDRGPYVAGRTFDLTAPVKNAIGAGPLATVRFTVVG
jgi:rare lipoprotein A